MRLIDADALKSRIEQMWEQRQLTNTKHKTFTELLDAEITIEAQQWILCSERLPEEDRAYLVTNSQWGYPILEITYWVTDGWQTKGKPIAWMPLPEPWKGDEE